MLPVVRAQQDSVLEMWMFALQHYSSKIIVLRYIAYTKQRENHGSMILHGAIYSAYKVL